ncbi:fructose-bisphosphate aldolase class I, partial [Candidatus Saccharibacteria bacterium]|nr:fructose-bisphosphate aldolase class I [Candidatus Saccharibacteria bacterium]
DERRDSFEEDEDGVFWMNLGFNGEGHNFFSRVPVFSGAVVTLEVLEKFGIKAKISGSKAEFLEDGEIKTGVETANYRYVICKGEEIAYFVPSERKRTDFMPEKGVKWVFVDRSANITRELTEKIKDFLSKNKTVRLAVYAPKKMTKTAEELVLLADFVFSDGDLAWTLPRGKVCFFSETGAKIDGAEVSWIIPKKDLLTHLSVYSIAAASFLGASLKGKPVEDALLYANLNVENSKRDETMPFEILSERVEEEKTEGANIRLIAASLVAKGKGILAADESGGSIHKKFEEARIPDDYEHRRDYRNIFFTTEGLEKYVNGVILFDETARQLADDGRNFVDFLISKGIIPGIKVDQGLVNFPGSSEKFTIGLKGLSERLNEYYEMGLRFAKWRAAFEITPSTPTKLAIKKNAEILADYALLCQKAKIVPIVEPEVVHDGDYSIEKCAKVTGEILDELFEALKKKKVKLSGTILKVNMVLAGKKFPTQSTPEEVGEATAKVLREHVPKEIAGGVFLSGGPGVEQATENLQHVTNNGPLPFLVTFSFVRALQAPALEAWKGDNKNAEAARAAFKERLIANTKALKKN